MLGNAGMPGVGITSQPPDKVAFREAMSRVVASVHIVSTGGKAGLGGITANSVTSVSDAPAIMLTCVNRTAHSAPRFLANRNFCINTLAASDQELANIFAGRTGLHLDARFAKGLWEELASGAPVLASAIAVFDCRLMEVHDVGSHHILIGEVLAVRHGAGKGLAYHNRDYLVLT